MSSTITITSGMSRKHDTNTRDTHDGGTQRNTLTQTGVGQVDLKQTIGTVEETVAFTDIATNGWCKMQNMDVNYVEWGFSAGVYGGRMRAYESAGPFRVNAGATIYLKANTAACRVRVIMYED